jgi:hypothetical protein
MMVSVRQNIQLNCRMTTGWYIGKDIKRSGRSLIILRQSKKITRNAGWDKKEGLP